VVHVDAARNVETLPSACTRCHLEAIAVSGNRIVAAGDPGVIVSSIDDGKTWSQRPRDSAAFLSGIPITDGGKGLVVGDWGTVLGSDDGFGWAPLTRGATGLLTSVVTTPDGGTAWAVGTGPGILKSEDGGLSWVPQL